MTEQTMNIVKAIAEVPRGKVATYGQIASAAGYPRGARQVSWTLRTQTKKFDLPWHRIVGSPGKISLKGDSGLLQADLLRAEGVEVGLNGHINLKKFGCFS